MSVDGENGSREHFVSGDEFAMVPSVRLDLARAEIDEWRRLWREFHKLQGAGNTPELRNRLRELLRQGDALTLRA